MKTPTYREIAAACGVNSSTVSRALGNHRGIPDRTRDRIRAVALKMGWRPNPLASAYMSHLRATHPPSFQAVLGLLIDAPIPHGIDYAPSHLQLIHQGMTRRAAEYGYLVRVFGMHEPGMTSQKIDRILFNHNISGFAIAGATRARTRLEELRLDRYTAVALGFSLVKPALHRVATSMYHSTQLLLRRVFAMGYKRLAVVVGREFDNLSDHGVRFAVDDARQRLKPGQSLEMRIYDNFAEKDTEKIAAWLKECEPDMLVGSWAINALDLLGWKVPRDIGMVTFDHSPEYLEHAGLDQCYAISAEIAADVLINGVTHNRRGVPKVPVEHTICGKWVDGPSAPPRR